MSMGSLGVRGALRAPRPKSKAVFESSLVRVLAIANLQEV